MNVIVLIGRLLPACGWSRKKKGMNGVNVARLNELNIKLPLSSDILLNILLLYTINFEACCNFERPLVCSGKIKYSFYLTLDSTVCMPLYGEMQLLNYPIEFIRLLY